MIRHRTALAGCLLILGVAACAPTPPPPAATPPQNAGPPEPAGERFRKKPRMNGRGEVTSISLERFFDLHQSGKTMVFDARPGFFYQLSHIPGAVHLPKNNCDAAIHKREAEIKTALASGMVLVVYCSGPTCPDARAVARHLSGFGYPASVLTGGWDAWKDAGMPTE